MFRHRLLLLTEEFPPRVGGIQSYLSGLWGALPPESSSVLAPSLGVTEEKQSGYHLVRAPFSGWTYPRWRPALHALRNEVERFSPEAIVCGKALFEGRAVRALNARRGANPLPYVVLTYAMEIETWLRSWRTRSHLLRVLKDAARVVVINSETKRLLHSIGVSDKKLVKIYPGVDEAFFSVPDGVETYRRQNGLMGKRVVLSICRLVPRKGIDVVLRALPRVIERVPDVLFCVAGDGPEMDRLKALTRELDLEEHVRFVGEVSQDDLHRLLAIAEYFVLTPVTIGSDREGFGIVYLEAAAAGKCAIGSQSGGVPEAVLDQETGLLVPEGESDALARRMLELLMNQDLRDRLASAARARAEREFRWSRRALLFQAMMEAVIREHALARGQQVFSKRMQQHASSS